MALTRKMLEALQIPENAIQTIIDEHTAVTSKINEELKAAKAQNEAVQKELDDIKAGDWENKFTTLNEKWETLNADIAAKSTKEKKQAAISAYYEGKNIKGANLKIALRGTDFNAIEVDEDGKIKDAKALDELVKGDFAGLVEKKDRVIDTGVHTGDSTSGGTVSYNLKDALKEAYKRD